MSFVKGKGNTHNNNTILIIQPRNIHKLMKVSASYNDRKSQA